MSNDNTPENKAATNELPVVPLRDMIIFPHTIVPTFVGRDKSVAALEKAMENGPEGAQILCLLQKDATTDDPGADELYGTGVVCNILQILQLPDGQVKLLLEGAERANVSSLEDNGTYVSAKFEPVENKPVAEEEKEALYKMLTESFAEYAKVNKMPADVTKSLESDEVKGDLSYLADAIIAHIKLPLEDKQALLENADVADRLKQVYGKMNAAADLQKVERRIKKSVKESMEKTQKEYYLNEQLKAIKKEMGDDEEDDPIAEYEEKIKTMDLPEETREKATREVKKLKGMNPQSAEATVSRNYLDQLLGVPWGNYSEINYDLEQAGETLNTDHYGLEKVKEQVLENLAVEGRLKDADASDDAEADILCLVGPPGVGKTSICKSLAKATGREYVRMAVGGVRDEAEIRGHRRTYIGSKPGKVIEKLQKAGTLNPLFVIDEIDKMGSDHRGDPAAAMLEVLDPEQNDTFEDHYLEVPVDLSKVKFVCTANVWANIPGPLQDRMETIFLGSYTEDEKLEIAKQHLLRKQRKAHNLTEDEFKVSEDALRDLVRYYTKESGVRTLQREIKRLCRKAVVELGKGDTKNVSITSENLEQYAGKRKVKYELVEPNDEVGVVTGLAYTSVGGETLSIEATKWTEKGGRVIQSGSLGDVMKESIQVAEGWLKAKASSGEINGLSIDDVLKTTYRVHVPEGATPKDGPSAGAAMLTAIFSAATNRKIKRDVAMTGELSLRGKVTAIGGLREKLSAASRAGYKTVLIPEDNVKDLDEVPQQVLDALDVKPVSTIEEVLNYALVDSNDLFKKPDNDNGAATVPPAANTGSAPSAQP